MNSSTVSFFSDETHHENPSLSFAFGFVLFFTALAVLGSAVSTSLTPDVIFAIDAVAHKSKTDKRNREINHEMSRFTENSSEVYVDNLLLIAYLVITYFTIIAVLSLTWPSHPPPSMSFRRYLS